MPPDRPPVDSPAEIGVGLMGLGTVGGAVACTLLDPAQPVAQKVQHPVRLKKVLVRDLVKSRPSSVAPELLTTDPRDILDDPEIHVVVEVTGGESPATEYIRRALECGKHVATANKEVMATHGPDLIRLAASRKVNLLFEASVGGGIPIIGPLTKDLLANDISSIHAIINGTTNYILTRMARDRIELSQAVTEAQDLGYAEADPTNDVDGTDAAHKLAVLASLAFHARVHSKDVYREGISRLEAQDFRYAQELGYAIKLLAIGRRQGDTVQVRVHPCLVPEEHMLSKVDGVYNAIEVEGDLIGRVLFHGMGAGPLPTTSAVIGDVVEIARKLRSGSDPFQVADPRDSIRISSMSELTSKFYLRVEVADQSGVLAQIARVLGDQDISISAVIQKDADPTENTAELVVTTHPAKEEAVQESLKRLKRLDVVRGVNNLLRVEEWSLA